LVLEDGDKREVSPWRNEWSQHPSMIENPFTGKDPIKVMNPITDVVDVV
jgi:hypothetical protein